MKIPQPSRPRIDTDPQTVSGADRYVDQTAGTDISVLASRSQQTENSYYHNLLDVLLQQKPETGHLPPETIEKVASLHERSALELVLGHFCPAYHQFLRSYLELAHSLSGIGSFRVGLETEVFLKALLALQQLVSHPAATTRPSQAKPPARAHAPTDSATLRQWVQVCRPSHAFDFSFLEDEDETLASLSLLQRLIIQNLVMAILGWTSEGRQLGVTFHKIQRHSTGKEYLSLMVSTPDNLMGRILSSTLKGPRQAPGQLLKLEGSGLGYHLATSLMAQLQGELVVALDDTGGTRFELHFPLQSHTERYIEPGFLMGDELAWMEPGIGFSVVYIEDVKSHAMLVKQIVGRMTDIKLHVADTGQGGLDLTTLTRPDLVLLDMELPDMNGLDVFAELQQRPQTAGIPVVAISASAMNHQVNQARELGVRHYLSKPFSHRELLDILSLAKREKFARLVI